MNWVAHNIFIMLYVLPRISECRQELRDFAEAEYGPNGDLTRGFKSLVTLWCQTWLGNCPTWISLV